jgi:hypothetical protein
MLSVYGIGDQKLFVIDIHASLLIGTGPPRVHQAASRWLNTHLPHVTKKYASSLEANILQHHLIKKLGKAHTQGTGKEDTQRRINLVYEEGGQYMTHAKCHCRKLKSGRICFSWNHLFGLSMNRFTTHLLNTSWVQEESEASGMYPENKMPLLNFSGIT